MEGRSIARWAKLIKFELSSWLFSARSQSLNENFYNKRKLTLAKRSVDPILKIEKFEREPSDIPLKPRIGGFEDLLQTLPTFGG